MLRSVRAVYFSDILLYNPLFLFQKYFYNWRPSERDVYNLYTGDRDVILSTQFVSLL